MKLTKLLKEIQIQGPSGKIKTFAEKNFDDSDLDMDNLNAEGGPAFGGWQNLHDGGPEEFTLRDFLRDFDGKLSKEEIAILWVYVWMEDSWSTDNYGKEEIDPQLTEFGFNLDSITNRAKQVVALK